MLAKKVYSLLRNPAEVFWFHPTSKMILRLTKLEPEKILDLGFNQGNSTLWLAWHTNAPSIVCADISVTGKKKLAEKVQPFTKPFPVQCNAERLPFYDSLFDVVFCRSVIQYCNYEKTIDEIRRILTPQGRCFLVANLTANPFIALYRTFFRINEKRKNFSIQKHLPYRDILKWQERGYCVFHQEFHLLTPLLFPLIKFCRCPKLSLFLITGFSYIEQGVFLIIPWLKRLSWYSFMEIHK